MKTTVPNFRTQTTVTLLILLIGLCCNAQQDAQYTQYMYNTVSVNPAYAGSRGHLSIAALYRAQWVGLDGAPETQTLNLHTPVGYRGVGLGLSVVNDVIGPTSETYLDGDFSYTIQLDFDKKLSFGLKASAHLLDVDFAKLNRDFAQGDDQSLQQNIDNRLSPNFGAGIYYHTDKLLCRPFRTSIFENRAFSRAVTFYRP